MRKIDKAYEFIKNYITEKEYPPTIREIGDAINVKSTSTVAYYLNRLEQQNKIIKGNYKNRSIQLIENISSKPTGANIISLPYISSIDENKSSVFALHINNRFNMSASLFKGLDMFLMPVKDNSMKDSAILKGDMVVVSRQHVARNGEIVVASIGATYVIGRLFKDFKVFRLQFDNKNCEPSYFEKITILGKVVGVIRNEIE
ncbi:MAG: repressor LexA [Clostridia bacterium]|nr:repressor LexA [Clostridia bacterium]